jgi:hypothetical protein
MNRKEQIINWLSIAFEQPQNSLSEIFYFDRRDNQFFSILFTDYFMLDENLNLAAGVTTSYTKANETLLIDRIKRIEGNHPAIVRIPRLPLEEALGKYDRGDILIKVNSFLDSNGIDIEMTTLWEIEEQGSVTIDLTKDSDLKQKKKRKYWWWPW